MDKSNFGPQGSTKGTKPVQHIQCGSVRASVWKNTAEVKGEEREFYNVTFQRSYLDGKEWKNVDSYGVGDLPKIAAIADVLYKQYGMTIGE